MLDEARQRHSERLGQLAHGVFAALESSQHRAPRRVGERAEDGIEAGRLIVNHMVHYMRSDDCCQQAPRESGRGVVGSLAGVDNHGAAPRGAAEPREETMSKRLSAVHRRTLAAVGVAAIVVSFAGAQQPAPPSAPPPAAPAAAPTPATVPPVPASTPDQERLRVLAAKNYPGKVHVLPATLETTQWGWFNNAQPPVLHVDSGDTIVFETMMHSHNQVVPGATIEQIKKLRTD